MWSHTGGHMKSAKWTLSNWTVSETNSFYSCSEHCNPSWQHRGLLFTKLLLNLRKAYVFYFYALTYTMIPLVCLSVAFQP